jgi:16S rRNA (cytidine1402-2'-O)-methyltransferase
MASEHLFDASGATPATPATPRAPTLWLVPTPLDFGIDADLQPLQAVLPMATIERAASLRHWVCENAKSLRAFLKRVDAVAKLPAPLAELNIQELPRDAHKKGDHAPGLGLSAADSARLLAPLRTGADLGFASEAGLPCVADPGSSLVRAAHAQGVAVHSLNGSSALLMALAASGLNGQSFAFVGYLPANPAERRASLTKLQQHIQRTGQTQIAIETPFRNAAWLETALQTLDPNLRLAIAAGLGTPTPWTRSATVAEWRNAQQKTSQTAPLIPNKLPAVFLLGL